MPDQVTIPRSHEQVLEQYRADFPDTPIDLLQRLAADTVHDEQIAATLGAPPPCPSWCISKPGHDYDSIDREQRFITRDGGRRCLSCATGDRSGATVRGDVCRSFGNRVCCRLA